MSQQISCSRESIRRLLWRGIRGEPVGAQLECQQETSGEMIQEMDFVARVMPVIQVEQNLMNMRTYLGGVKQISDADGQIVENPVLYGNLLHNMACNEDWIAIAEYNKDGIFHVHTLCKTGVRSDSYRRTANSVWEQIKRDPTIIEHYGNCPLDMLKCQKAHRATSLLEYMCKAPVWILSNTEKLLQMTYDIETWNLGERFKASANDQTASIDNANPMIQEILECIMQHNCKTFEEVVKKGPEVTVKYLHRPGFSSIVQNCLIYAKCVGHTWSLQQYGKVVPDPSGIHCVLLHQGIAPTHFDYIFWQWITKRHLKRNCIHLYGPSNTGKSCFLSGLGKCCPGGEIVNGNSFQFEGLIDVYWGRWEEPLCPPEMAEKFKQVAEGMETAIPVKFKRPYMLPRTPIFITTNSMIWDWCPNQKGPFKNRMWFFEFLHDMSDGIFHPRVTESGCECRYCGQCRSGPSTSGIPTTSGVQRDKQSISKQLVSRSSSEQPAMGTRSMCEGAGSSRQSNETECSGGESSSNTAAGGSTCTTISDSSGSCSEHGSSNTNERVCDSTTRSTKQLESDSARGCDGDDIRQLSGGSRSSGRHDVRSNIRRHVQVHDVVSMGGTREKKRKMEIPLQTSEQQLGGQLDTKMKIPGKDEWSNYLAYIYHRYEKASVPDLSAYEDLHSDSE
nr:NS1 [Chicken chapparvovirus 2]